MSGGRTPGEFPQEALSQSHVAEEDLPWERRAGPRGTGFLEERRQALRGVCARLPSKQQIGQVV